MQKQKIFILIGIIVILIAGGVFAWQYFATKSQQNSQFFGSSQKTNQSEIYKNTKYGFQITLPADWKGYSLDNTKQWDGVRIDVPPVEGGPDYTGPEIIIKNPNSTPQQYYQDIPIMVFTPDVWKLVSEEKVGVSAAPIGPEKIGENSKYVFALPPRWCGFSDAIGCEEATNITKTFKAF